MPGSNKCQKVCETASVFKLVYLAILLLLCLAISLAVAQTEEAQLPQRIRPTPDDVSPTGVYIPKDLTEALAELKKVIPADVIRELKDSPESDIGMYHSGLGMWLRNNWGLWHGSRLQEYFLGLGIEHPVDMSAIVFRSFWRELHGQPINLDDQVACYVEWWAEQDRLQEQYKDEDLVPFPDFHCPDRRPIIEVCNPAGEKEYLERLRCLDGYAPTFRRTGNVGKRNPVVYTEEVSELALNAMHSKGKHESSEINNHILDRFAVECLGKTYILYLDMYHCEQPAPERAPPGFTIVPVPKIQKDN